MRFATQRELPSRKFYEKILVPCDFSKPAIEAYKFAITVASKTDGEVFVLHVIDIPIINEQNSLVKRYRYFS